MRYCKKLKQKLLRSTKNVFGSTDTNNGRVSFNRTGFLEIMTVDFISN